MGRFPINFVFINAICLFLWAGCSDEPSREKFPGGMGRTTETQRAETQRAVLGGFDPTRSQLPGSQRTAEPSGQPKKISGTLKIAKSLKLPKSGHLFISARSLGAGGPPVAVKRLPLPSSFPFQFELTENDQMMKDSERFDGDLMITARIDQDGDPLSRQEGDLAATLNAKVGETGLQMELTAPKE